MNLKSKSSYLLSRIGYLGSVVSDLLSRICCLGSFRNETETKQIPNRNRNRRETGNRNEIATETTPKRNRDRNRKPKRCRRRNRTRNGNRKWISMFHSMTSSGSFMPSHQLQRNCCRHRAKNEREMGPSRMHRRSITLLGVRRVAQKVKLGC